MEIETRPGTGRRTNLLGTRGLMACLVLTMLVASSLALLPTAVDARASAVGQTALSSIAHRATAPSPDPAGASLLGQARASLSAAAVSGPNWAEVAHTPPTTRVGESMVYDAKDKVYVLFGGWDPLVQVLRDTWELKASGVWSNVTSGTSPPPRWEASMAYDAADGYVVMFGGQGSSLTGALSDTWKFSAGVWTKLTPATHPAGVVGGSMTYDAKDGYAILFGGTNSAGTPVRTTWEFKAGAWTQLHPSVSPSARTESAMAFDAKDNYTVLFGGVGIAGTLGDTWNFVRGGWTNITPVVSPPARYGSGMGYSTPDARLVLFGGQGVTSLYADTWTFVAGTWSKLISFAHPSKRGLFAIGDGPTGGAVTLFGGSTNTGTGNDTWKLSGNVWKSVIPAAPILRQASAITYDEADGYVLLFGGSSGAILGDTWKFVGGVWTQLHPSVSPSPRINPAMTYDALDGYVLLFGGQGNGHICSDTWTFVHGTWTNITPIGSTSSPVARTSAGMAYDYIDGYVVMFGGTNFTVQFADTWSFQGGAWNQLSLIGAPTARYSMELTYDSEDGYVLLVGGEWGFSNFLNDTWSYLGGTWTNLTAVISGGVDIYNAHGALFDDAADGYMVLFVAPLGSTYKFDGFSWTLIATANSPPPSYTLGQGGTYDPVDQCGVVLTTQGSTWEYTG